MGGSICSCNNKDNSNLEFKVTEGQNKTTQIENIKNVNYNVDDNLSTNTPDFIAKNKFSPYEATKLKEIYMLNLIRKIQRFIRSMVNPKDMSMTFNNNFSSNLKFGAGGVNIKYSPPNNNVKRRKTGVKSIDESSILLFSRSEINAGLSDWTNIINNLTAPSEEKIKFNIQDESEIELFKGSNVNGKMEGYCHIYWKDGSEFKGTFMKGQANGIGYLTSIEGDIFCGEFTNDRISGFGISKHRNGTNFIGFWEEDTQTGLGAEVSADTSNYSGEYFKGKKHGLGCYKWADGSIYHGYWVDNKIQGFGIYYFTDGKYYIGQWKNNTMSGYGEFYWLDGKRYIGYYTNDKKDGFGIYYWAKSKRLFVGFWKNGKQEGVGKIINGKKVKYGFWKEGDKVKSFKEELEGLSTLTKKQMPFKKFFLMTYQEIILLL